MAKTYDTYKDSGIAWIGNIPSEWNVDILSLHLYDHCNYNKELKEKNLLSLSYGRIVRKDINTKEGLLPESFNRYNIIEKGDIVLRLTDLQNDKKSLRTGLCQERGIITSAYLTLRNRGNDSSAFLHYLLHSYDLCKVFYGMGNGVRQGMNYSDIRKLKMIIPPFPEQEAIASFLDRKCSEIDSLISLQEEMISELQAYKQSIITKAVTKGLDPNAPMKDSGVEWIGILPKKWSNAKLKNIIDYIESGVSVNAGIENVTSTDIGVLKTSSVSKNTFIPTECKKVFETELSRVSCPVKGNTIIVSRMNTPELVGACGYVEKDYNNIFLPDRLWQVHFQETVHVKYIYYCLVSKRVKSYFSSLSSGTSSSMQNITQGQFQNTAITLPPLSEQQAIASYLDEKTSQIDSLIALKQEKITELKDYKKSIIYEYVTGKKKV